MLVFLQENQIQDMQGLDDKLKEAIDRQFDIRDEFKPIDERLNTLAEHLKHSANFKHNRSYKAQYEKLYSEYKTLKKSSAFGAKRKAQKALDTANEYYRENQWQIQSYETAEDYLKGVLSKFDTKKLPPITKWTNEQAELLGKKSALNGKYRKLKSDVDNISKIRSSAYNILSRERKRVQNLNRQKSAKYMDRGGR